ncbi:sulfatase [Bordetella pertussis]|nr:sulfatase [Bordetella pertussis]
MEPNVGPNHLETPYVFNLMQDPKEETDVNTMQGWVRGPIRRMVNAFQASLKSYPPIPPGAPDDYAPSYDMTPPAAKDISCERGAAAPDTELEDALLARLAGRRGIAVAHHCGIAVVWEAWARAPSSGAADMSSVRVDRYRLCLDAGGAGQGAGTAP